MAYLLLSMDDIVLTASLDQLFRRIISALTAKFNMKDMGPLHHFWVCLWLRTIVGSFSHSASTCLRFLSEQDCKPCPTLVDTSAADGPRVSDATHYRGLAGAL
jgi:hypothetical protein